MIARLWKPWPPSVMDAVAQFLVVPSETFEVKGKDLVISACCRPEGLRRTESLCEIPTPQKLMRF